MASKKTIVSVNISVIGTLATTAEDLTKRQIWVDDKFIEDDEGKYSVTMLVNKDSISGEKLETAFSDLMEKAEDELGNVKKISYGGSAKYRCNIMDGDVEEHFTTHKEYMKNHYVVTFKVGKSRSKSRDAYKLFGIEGERIKLDNQEDIDNEFYAGAICRLRGAFYYLGSGNIGMYGSLRELHKKGEGNELFGDIDHDYDENDEDEQFDLEFYQAFLVTDEDMRDD